MSQGRSAVDRGINKLLLVATEMAKPREIEHVADNVFSPGYTKIVGLDRKGLET